VARLYPHLQQRGNRFFFRRRVPDELRPVVRKLEIRETLRTSDRKHAHELVRLASVKCDALFSDARRKLRTAPVTTISETEIKHVVLNWFYAKERKAAAGARQSSDDDENADDCMLDTDDALSQLVAEEQDLQDEDHPNTLSSVQNVANRLLVDNHISIPGLSSEYLYLCELIRRGMIERVRRAKLRVRGDYAHRPYDLFFGEIFPDGPPPSRVRAVTLSRLIERYKGDPKRAGLSSKTKLKYEAQLRLIENVIGGNRLVSEVTRDDTRAVQDVLKVLPANSTKRFRGMSTSAVAALAQEKGLPPMSPSAANSYLIMLSGLLEFAVSEELIDRNPAKGLKFAADTTKAKLKRDPFSIKQLRTIFRAPLYTGCQDDGHGYDEPGPHVIRRGRFWVPLISLYTGMRLNEICQLNVNDVAVRDKTRVILVREDDEDIKRVKTDAGERYVPVHPELIKIGFLRYADEMRKRDEKRVFPELRVSKATGYYSDNFSKWFSHFLAKIGANEPRTSFHSFRHSYRDALREADISIERVRALGGWSGGGATEETYGSGLRPSTLAKEIAKVHYPKLNLSHLYHS
jgi:integrase